MRTLRDNCSGTVAGVPASVLVAALFCTIHVSPLLAEAKDAAPADVNTLAKQQQNPISSLVSMPLQFNFNTGGGLEDQTFLPLNAVRGTSIPVHNLQGHRAMSTQNTTTIDLPEAKRTTLGLYVTSAEAYDMWKTAPENVKILDVRTPEEFIFVGHAEMAWNIPAFLQTYDWDASAGRFSMKLNPAFMTNVKDVLAPTDTILVTCRSGGRSAMAVNQLAGAGFTKVYNIIDGVEGDPVNDAASVFQGKHVRNGWKNAGVPWTYSVDPRRMRLPANR